MKSCIFDLSFLAIRGRRILKFFKNKKKSLVNRGIFVKIIYRWRAKKCEVAETPINVVMAVFQGIRME